MILTKKKIYKFFYFLYKNLFGLCLYIKIHDNIYMGRFDSIESLLLQIVCNHTLINLSYYQKLMINKN